ncbi:SDR family NAD(P)-dependent oxidoreductase [Roseomonas sp. CCTCC AB2023176]|uniref:SDR family NAD(P)-dependent oxidoreductase n=1 Tax=Roseomonas sp. CCTCC AB2023176 TaxID=3342640 RepID=UPI0035D8909E
MSPARTYARALVTGATSGIGESFARALNPGTALLLTGRDAGKLDLLRQDLTGQGGSAQVIPADLTTEAGLDALSAAAGTFAPDLIILNAGTGPYGDLLAQDEHALRETLALNALAPLVLLRRLLPAMLDRARANGSRAGAIVTSSDVAFFPVPRLATYAATKAFDLSLTEALGAELASEPVDILALCPTATRTRFAKRSGFGPNLPGAQHPSDVAQSALRALGRQRTLTLGPVSGSVLAVPALVRYGIAEAIGRFVPRRGPAQETTEHL